MIYLKHLKKTYTTGEVSVEALKDISLFLPNRGMVFIVGKSGSGKSTLLNMLGGLDVQTEGEIWINDVTLNSEMLDSDTYRSQVIGFIFQDFNLNASLNVGENIASSLRLQNIRAEKERISEALQEVGLPGYEKKKINQLSGGEQQRVAIARALVKNPQIILADEPTGNLDSFNGENIFEILKKLSQRRLIVIVSHDRPSAEKYGDRIIELSDGNIVSDTVRKSLLGKINKSIKNTVETDKTADEDAVAAKTEALPEGDEALEDGSKTLEETDADVLVEMPQYVPEPNVPAPAKVGYEKRKPLNFLNAMFFAFKNLLSRKYKTIVTIIICTLTFAIFGLSFIISTYSVGVANSKSFLDNHTERDIVIYKGKERIIEYQHIEINKGPVPDENIEYIKKEFEDSYIPLKNLNGYVIGSNTGFNGTYTFDIYGVYEMTAADIPKLGWTLMDFPNGRKSRFPETGAPVAGFGVSEIVVTDVLALLLKRELQGIPSSIDLILADKNFESTMLDQIVSFGANECRIVGIFDTGYKDKYIDQIVDGFSEEDITRTELFYMVQNFYCMLYSGPGFAKNAYVDSHPTGEVHFVSDLNKAGKQNDIFNYYLNHEGRDLVTFADGYTFTGTLADDEIILTDNYFINRFRKDFDPSTTEIVDGEIAQTDFTGFKVVGIIEMSTSVNKFERGFGAVVSKASLQKLADAQAYNLGARVTITDQNAGAIFKYNC